MEWSSSGGGGGGDALVGGTSDPNNILVFGYACKLFRDDEKATWVEEGAHLIPSPLDGSLIDRYDARGALMDLRGNTAGAGDSVEPFEGASMDPGKLVRLLDEERYRDLAEEPDMDDKELQEVEFKKFQTDVMDSVGRRENSNSYAAIGYSYDNPSNASIPTSGPSTEITKTEDDQRSFVPPKGLIVPLTVIVPSTMKLHSIIEKTAKFIASHGSQMEIILKTKQSGNPSFNFLDYKDVLNPYFKFLVQAIRDNLYTPQESTEAPSVQESSNNGDSSSADESGDEDGYLHPSLFRSSGPDVPSKQAPSFKPSSGNTAYSLLVSKIRGTSGQTVSPTPNEPTGPGAELVGDSYIQYANVIPYQGYPQQATTYPPDPFGTAFGAPQHQFPNPNDQIVIEKMAGYVVKNGPAFENLALSKGDPRFIFLNPSHEYHWYYMNCKERFLAESAAVVANQQFHSYSMGMIPSPSEMTNSALKSLGDHVAEQNNSTKKLILKAVELPLSASGIPIANIESISNRPTTIPPEVASRIEMIKKKKSLLIKKETSPPKIQFSASISKGGSIMGIEIDKAEVITHFEPDSTSAGFEVVPVPELDKDAERQRKEMRRRKAALFLQKISAKLNSDSTPKPEETAGESVVAETKDQDNAMPDQLDLNTSEKRNGCPVVPSKGLYNSSGTFVSVISPLPYVDQKNGNCATERKSETQSSKNNSRGRSRCKSYSPDRGRSRSRSLASGSSNSSSNRRRRSKQKTSKKRKKKHERERSRSSSRSRKSKKRKRQ